MTNDKRKALTKYLTKLNDQLTAPVTAKHKARGSHDSLKVFLRGEIKAVKIQLEAEALAIASVGVK